jgi:hypothetical protein
MLKCGYPGCFASSKSSCSGCGREHYCSSECQKLDWKKHKPMCPILKKLSNKQQSVNKVIRIISDIISSGQNAITGFYMDVRILEHLLSYAQHQFGKKIVGENYWERENGEHVSNWIAEFVMLNSIVGALAIVHGQNHSINSVSRDLAKFPYLERSLDLLNPWLNQLNSLSKDNINILWLALFRTEQDMALVTINRGQFDKAEGHCQRCLAYSRKYISQVAEKITLTFTALRTYCQLREYQSNFSDALIFAEEGYNLNVEVYDPVHSKVQEAAGILINILIKKRDLSDAERYAEVTYSNLRDKKNGMDQNGEEVANGAYNLSNIIQNLDGDLVRAESLREMLFVLKL